MTSPQRAPKPSKPSQPQEPVLSPQEKLAQVQAQQQKWSMVAASPNLSPKAAAWARNAARSFQAAADLYQKGIAETASWDGTDPIRNLEYRDL